MSSLTQQRHLLISVTSKGQGFENSGLGKGQRAKPRVSVSSCQSRRPDTLAGPPTPDKVSMARTPVADL